MLKTQPREEALKFGASGVPEEEESNNRNNVSSDRCCT
jgi:hypothetical protein